MPSVLIQDIGFANGQHGDKVRTVFETYAPSSWSVIEYLDSTSTYRKTAQAVDKAIAEGAVMHLRPAAPWGERAELRRAWANGILPMSAHGSNTDEKELSKPPYLFESVVSGAEDTSDNDRETSEGPGLELDGGDTQFGVAQSWATPLVAGKLAAAYSALPSDPDQERWLNARAHLRTLANTYNEGWDEDSGFGVVSGSASVPASINPKEIPLQPPVSATYTDAGSGVLDVTFTPYEQTRYARTVIEDENGNEVWAGTESSATIITDSDPHELRFRTDDGRGNRSRFTSATRAVDTDGYADKAQATASGNDAVVTVPALPGITSYVLDRAEGLAPFQAVRTGGREQKARRPDPARPFRYRLRPQGAVLGEPASEPGYVPADSDDPVTASL